MRPLEWFNSLLARHNLERPDGRPLYQYRLTDDEYKLLYESLKLSSMFGIKNITNMLHWDAAFVIYAADWWRRYYNGNWGWEDIFSSIGLDHQDLSTGRRNDLVELGLQRWRREVRTFKESRKYLGTIATEGGLPLHQLTEAKGWLEKILKPVIKKHISNGYSIQSLIESYNDLIPSAFRGNEVTAILSDMVQVTVGLREKYKLHEQVNPAAYLDSILPAWREKFPLPINDKIAATLLSDLIKAASEAKIEIKSVKILELKRILIRADSDRPEVTLSVEIPTFIELPNIGVAADIELPANLDMELCSANGKVYPLGRAIQTQKSGETVLRTFCIKTQITGIDALSTYIFNLKSLGIVVHSKPIIETAILDCDIPWLFKKLDEKWMLQGTATQSTSQENVFAYIPNRFSVDYKDGSSVISFGKIFEGNIYKLHGMITCREELESYKLSAGKVDSAQQYDLTGKQLPYPTMPSETYIGIPELISLNPLTGQVVNQGALGLIARPIGSDMPWRSVKEVAPGNYEIRLLNSDGIIVLRKRIAILPNKLFISLRADKVDAKSGEIIFNNIDGMDVSILNSDLNITKTIIVNGISIKAKAIDSPPSTMKICLKGSGHKNDIALTLPFPARGAILRNAKGKKVSNASNLCLETLYGYRIHYYDDRYKDGKKAYLEFRLIDADVKDEIRQDIYLKSEILLVGEITILAVNDWKETIIRLLSVSRSLDAAAQIILFVDSQEKIALTIKQYAHSLEVDYRTGRLELSNHSLTNSELDSVTNTNIVPINLTTPHKQQTLLNPLRSEGVATGRWLFDMDARNAGPWILFPSKDSSLQFRPVLWLVSDSGKKDGGYDCELVSAISKESEPEREKAIRKVLIKMAEDKYHSGWDYISSLWEHTNHLPLTTFDLWRVGVTEPKFMAQLLLGTKNDVVAKIKAELPIMWELTPLSVWSDTLQRLKDEYEKNLDDVDLIRDLLNKKINLIGMLGQSFNGLIQILRLEFLGERAPELDAIKVIGKEFISSVVLSKQQLILTKKSNLELKDWPNNLKNKVSDLFKSYSKHIAMDFSAAHWQQQNTLFLPFLLAIQTITEIENPLGSTSSEVFKINCIRDFDNDWFDDIYSIVTQWIYIKNKFGIKNELN
jgi:hypothetical protein